MARRVPTETQTRFQQDLSDPRHGTQNGYTNLVCRCPRCVEAWRVWHYAYMHHPDHPERLRQSAERERRRRRRIKEEQK